MVCDPVLSLQLGQAQILAVTLSQGAGTPLFWGMSLPSPRGAHVLTLLLTEQEDEAKAAGEGKVEAEGRWVWLFQS